MGNIMSCDLIVSEMQIQWHYDALEGSEYL